ncbi:MAG: lytic murein transglycosylase, partial [Desulfobulbaceae bacterium]|nr:lytic murein transglycosylase [Desulfobulbaceae bacterium]
AVLILHGRLLQAGEGSHDFGSWLAEFKKEAISEGIPVSVVERALAGVELREEVLKKDRNQPEFKLTMGNYLDRIVSEQRVAKGRRMLAEHRPLLEEIADRYQIQPRFLLAFWGIESDYGRVLGDFPVIQSLVTLAFDPRRGNYFRKELLLSLHILADGLAPLERLQGSWAGAIGGLQFMPSVYRKYAVDYNDDGISDIWRNPADMFASGANYLTGSGWQFDQTWGREVALPDNFDPGLLGHKNSLTLAEWQELGVRRLYGKRDLPKREMSASLIIPDPDSGRAFLVYDNFRIILKWNRSNLFAIAVGMLADRIGAP